MIFRLALGLACSVLSALPGCRYIPLEQKLAAAKQEIVNAVNLACDPLKFSSSVADDGTEYRNVSVITSLKEDTFTVELISTKSIQLKANFASCVATGARRAKGEVYGSRFLNTFYLQFGVEVELTENDGEIKLGKSVVYGISESEVKQIQSQESDPLLSSLIRIVDKEYLAAAAPVVLAKVAEILKN